MLKSTERQLIAMILLMAAALGVAYALITPPWMNAEEPHHFEYIRLIAEQGALPDEPSLEVQQRIADSVIVVHRGWGVLGRMANARIRTELGVRGDEDWAQLRDELALRPGSYEPSPQTLGNTQLSEPPGYYLLLALLQLLVGESAIETQLVVARLGSVAFGILTIWFAYLAARELFPHQRLMRVGTPALVALLPAFDNIMSSVQNTVAAAAAVALVLFAAARLIRRGLSARRLLLLAIGAVACALSKPTAWVGVPLAVLAIPLARRKPWPRWLPWGAMLVIIGAGLAVASWQWPASWHLVSIDNAAETQAPHGQRVLVLGDDQPDTMLWQVLPAPAVERLRGQAVTIGAWMRAPEGPTRARLPGVWASPRGGTAQMLAASGEAVAVGETWEFHAATVTVPSDTLCMSVRLISDEDKQPGSIVYYDGVVLVEGAWPLDEPPTFQNRYATRGTWAGQPFANLVSNGSAERGQLLVRPELESVLDIPIADSGTTGINRRLASFQDWRANWPFLSQTLRWLFAGFWARFGWNTPGLPQGVIWGLGALSGLAGIGVLLFALRAAKRSPTIPLWQRRALGLCLAAGVLIFSLAVVRLDPFTLGKCGRYQGRFISTGYYVQPSVMPVLLFWLLGLQAWFPRQWHRWLLVGCILGFFVLNMGALLDRQIPLYLAAYGLESEPTLWSIPQAWLQ